jgi:hypothetical protein
MKVTVKKTDRRHTAANNYKYFVDIRADNYTERGLILEKFYEIRAWCWETWGPTREATETRAQENSWDGDKNENWSFINDRWRARIYLGNKDAAAYFTLKWI